MTRPATFTVACVQLNAGEDMAANIDAAAAGIRDARAAGADFITLPENVSMMAYRANDIRAKAMAENDHHALIRFRELARDTGAWLLIGSLGIKLDDERIANRSYLVDPEGAIVARYDKIHMFDVELPGGESYRESASFRSGDAATLAETPWGPVGLTVCYDLRFPHLYRALAQAGARFLTVPSAFTRTTGRAHWHVLLRARAIETGSFVIAPAQCGDHPGKRQTYGHSLIVAPWGEVLADGGETPGIVTAKIDPAKVDKARAMVPALAHDRAFSGPDRPHKPVRAIG